MWYKRATSTGGQGDCDGRVGEEVYFFRTFRTFLVIYRTLRLDISLRSKVPDRAAPRQARFPNVNIVVVGVGGGVSQVPGWCT